MTPAWRELLEHSCVDRNNLRVGVEIECFLFTEDRRRLDHEALTRLLKNIYENEPSWTPICEGDSWLGLCNTEGESLTLEPGGQLEYASPPRLTLHDLGNDLLRHKDRLKALPYRYLFTGFDPFSHQKDVPWVSKNRYDRMRQWMGADTGWDMMLRSCGTQINLDYTDLDDLVTKLRVSMALSPFVSMIFSNSSYKDSVRAPFPRYRSWVWQHTDAHTQRCGLLPFVLSKQNSTEDILSAYERYILSFSPSEFGVIAPSLQDRLSFVFPEVRLKPHLEIRGADAQDLEGQIALAKIWVKILYDPENLALWNEHVCSWPSEAIIALYKKLPEINDSAIFAKKSLRDWIDLIQEP